MKYTIITLTSAASLTCAANAQTFLSNGFTGSGITFTAPFAGSLGVPKSFVSDDGSATVTSQRFGMLAGDFGSQTLTHSFGEGSTSATINDSFVITFSVITSSFSFAATLNDDASFSANPTPQSFSIEAYSGGSLINSHSIIIGSGNSSYTLNGANFDEIRFIETGNISRDNEVFTFDAASVPEPSSTVLLGLGAVGLLARRKR